ncbi:ATP-binding protein [Streptomyces odontomachi]|uniref:ATP-binding protein n=1 Tax=Streptomyces odontomachi TaxID=2944940 RepID=UPI0027E33A72|nr:ATP-binding protein [Streptomyces sp. ODS25]
MSLPLTRRIARTALLVAAGAAPVIGAAGSASATVLPEMSTPVGLSTLDHAPTGVVDSASKEVTRTADGTAGSPVTAAQRMAGGAAGSAGMAAGGTAAHTMHGLPAA